MPGNPVMMLQTQNVADIASYILNNFSGSADPNKGLWAKLGRVAFTRLYQQLAAACRVDDPLTTPGGRAITVYDFYKVAPTRDTVGLLDKLKPQP